MREKDKPQPRGRPRKSTPDQMVSIAMEAYWQNDPADVSINAICHMAEISKPSLYRAFGNEDGLMRAALDVYADRVLSDVLAIVNAGQDLPTTLEALVRFAVSDPRMETGCLFFKMRAGKHRLGPETRALIEELEEAALAAYAAMLQAARDDGAWSGNVPVDAAAQYLNEQVGLAITQRGSGADRDRIEHMLRLALSVFS